MQNIWGFILQSVSLSLVGAVLLIVKRIFKDKLPPSWQYGIWSIFALRALIPVRADRFVVLPFGFYLELLKESAESHLDSAFTSCYGVTEMAHIFPVIKGIPQSITDIIFTVYFAGVIVFLCFYLFSYIKLRITLKKGVEVTGEEKERIKSVFESKKIKNIRIVYLNGIDSAFICGVIRPVLVIPFERKTDEKVLLHEIVHLKHIDSLQSIFWCILRSLHWCNPFLHWVFNVIGNDMESRCDQRVLEMLDGEERREYGILLLNEVNKKYARSPGTTSVSNGGRNISRRIEAITRFKKYPKGMVLVSICMIIILSIPVFFVSESFVYSQSVYYPKTVYEAKKSAVYSRLYRCGSLAGAIDTYAKALINNNGIMLLTVSPADRAEKIRNGIKDYCFYDSGFTSLKDSEYGGYNVAMFSLFNLIKTGEDKYSAVLAFSVPREATEEEKAASPYAVTGTLLVPIEVFKEKNYWVVNETGERTVSDNYLNAMTTAQVYNLKEELPSLSFGTQKGENGTFKGELYTVFSFNYDTDTEDGFLVYKEPENNASQFMFYNYTFDNTVHRNAEFDKCVVENKAVYTYEGEDRERINKVGYDCLTADKNGKFPEKNQNDYVEYSSYGPVNVDETWDGVENAEYTDLNRNPNMVKDGYATKFKYVFYVDGKAADEFIAEVNTNG